MDTGTQTCEFRIRPKTYISELTSTAPFDTEITEIVRPGVRHEYTEQVAQLKRKAQRLLTDILDMTNAEEEKNEIMDELTEEEESKPKVKDALEELSARYDELVSIIQMERQEIIQIKAKIRELRSKLHESKMEEQKLNQNVQTSYTLRLHIKRRGNKR